jgi:hypothetical protein
MPCECIRASSLKESQEMILEVEKVSKPFEELEALFSMPP